MIKKFENPEWQEHENCPLCSTNEDKPIYLVPIVGTEDGNNVEAVKIHVDCVAEQLWYYPEQNWLVAMGKRESEEK